MSASRLQGLSIHSFLDEMVHPAVPLSHLWHHNPSFLLRRLLRHLQTFRLQPNLSQSRPNLNHATNCETSLLTIAASRMSPMIMTSCFRRNLNTLHHLLILLIRRSMFNLMTRFTGLFSINTLTFETSTRALGCNTRSHQEILGSI